MRTGTQALGLLAVPLNVHVLRSLGEEPLSLPALRRAVGHPPVTTMRTYLRNLTELGVIERYREEGFPGSVSYAITPSGRQLSEVAEVLGRWLEAAPEGANELEDTAARSAIKALVDGWDVGLVRALAARPLALTELCRLIPQVSYPTLERRLTAMRQMGLVEIDPQGDGRVARCQVTPWLRHAVAPLAEAVGWECRWIPDRAPAPSRIDAEATFLLAVPLLSDSLAREGTCRLAVEFRRGSEAEFAGVTVIAAGGGVRSCVTSSEGHPDAWATGSIFDWCDWLGGRGAKRIEVRGDVSLATDLASGLRDGLLSTVAG